jgi:O-methyltransferase
VKRIITALAGMFGYEIRRKSTRQRELEAEARPAIAQVRPYTMLPPLRLLSLYDQVAHCDRHGLSGALVECGVWKGGAVALMALANQRHGKTRRHLHLFDSFQEICMPDAAVDGAQAVKEASRFSHDGIKGQLVSLKGFYDGIGGPGTLEENRRLLEQTIHYDPAFIHYHVGWFQDTMPRDAGSLGPVALLRIDGDWYASTKVCLDNLFDRVVPGGFVIIDDYGTYEGCRKAVDEFLERRGIVAYLHTVDAGCCYWVKS